MWWAWRCLASYPVPVKVLFGIFQKAHLLGIAQVAYNQVITNNQVIILLFYINRLPFTGAEHD